MARMKDLAPGWPQEKRIPHNHIEHGSAEHAALLGIPDDETKAAMDPEEVAARERLLNAEPVIACPERKKPVNHRTYQLEEPIIDGWARYGRR